MNDFRKEVPIAPHVGVELLLGHGDAVNELAIPKVVTIEHVKMLIENVSEIGGYRIASLSFASVSLLTLT